MGEKSKLDILINNYSIKYPLQFEPSDGQDLTGFLSWSKVGKVTWLIECITPRLRALLAGESFARTVKELRPHCERASANNEIFKFPSIFLAHLLVFRLKNVYLLFQTVSTSVICLEIRFYQLALLVALWQCGFSKLSRRRIFAQSWSMLWLVES